MGDLTYVLCGSEEEDEKLIAAADYIIRRLRSKKKLNDDVKSVLIDLGTQLSMLSIPEDDQNRRYNEIEERLIGIQGQILSWEVDESVLWDSDPDEVSAYLSAVDEARKLTERLETLCLDKDGAECELLRRAHDILQTAMARLEVEFRNILTRNKLPFEAGNMSFRSNEDDAFDESSISNESVDSLQRDSVNRVSGEFTFDLVNPSVIPDLRSIADLMFTSHYDHECSQAFMDSRKGALDECLKSLEIEKHSIEDVMKMEWNQLNSKVKRWIRALRIFVRSYLTSEKSLCDQIFGELKSASSTCFVEATKASMLQLLNFGEAVSIGPHQPEKLFRILGMYELLQALLPDIDTLYSDKAGDSVRTESHAVLRRLGDSVTATFLDFKNAIASNTSTQPFPGGGIHPIAKYVMNYITTLTDYSDTLNTLLKGHHTEDPTLVLLESEEDENTDENSLSSTTQMALHFQSVSSILESNLYHRSRLYRDASLQHFFLMNNTYYIAQKVKGSELRVIFGDDWIRKHNRNFQKYAMEYERAAWSSILTLLKDEGLQNPGSNSVSRTLLRERIRSFNLAFEELYRNQTAWIIVDTRLREDLRISTSLKVVQAYRTFVGRHINHIGEKYIKYTADDLQMYLLDLFEGSQKSLQNPNRRL